MEELSNLTYKDEVDSLKENDNFEELGDAKYLNHKDVEARVYWAFCRPNGSCEQQIKDEEPLVSIMAFNHSKLGALKRFQLLHVEVIKQEKLRVKIKNRTRMLFRDLIDNDFVELNQVLELVPVFLDVAIDQLKRGRRWNEIAADDIEATKFLRRVGENKDEEFYEALETKLVSFEEMDSFELKKFLELKAEQKMDIDAYILKYYHKKAMEWIEDSPLHLLQKKSIEKLAEKLLKDNDNE